MRPATSAAAGHGAEDDGGAHSRVVVGLMSGTSLDGVDAAAVRLRRSAAPGGGATYAAELLAFESTPYAPPRRDRLAAALRAGSPQEYCRLGFDLGAWFAEAALGAMRRAGLTAADVDAVASHGQTVWHEAGHSTWQLGGAAVIAERTACAVVSDFRAADVAAGGQGAPLVAAADLLLFADPHRPRALQNLGGIGNVTVVPPRGGPPNGLLAFDTGPGVAVVDGVVRLLAPALPYDVDGRLARAGAAVPGVVDALLADPYFAAPPPKSTGRELFSPAYLARFVERCREVRPAASTADVVATAVALTAASVADAYRRFVPPGVEDVLVSGGGARNPALFEALRAALAAGPAPRRVRRFDDVFFDGDAKEAVAFALLGALHLWGDPGNVPAATGARGPRVLGVLTPRPSHPPAP